MLHKRATHRDSTAMVSGIVVTETGMEIDLQYIERGAMTKKTKQPHTPKNNTPDNETPTSVVGVLDEVTLSIVFYLVIVHPSCVGLQNGWRGVGSFCFTHTHTRL